MNFWKSKCTQRKDEDIEKHCDWFKNQVEVIENCSGELDTKDKFSQQDPVFKELSETEQQDENEISEAKEHNGEGHLTFGTLANCDKNNMTI